MQFTSMKLQSTSSSQSFQEGVGVEGTQFYGAGRQEGEHPTTKGEISKLLPDPTSLRGSS